MTSAYRSTRLEKSQAVFSLTIGIFEADLFFWIARPEGSAESVRSLKNVYSVEDRSNHVWECRYIPNAAAGESLC